jgi:hypothetical protein
MTCIKARAATGRYQQRALATALTMVMEDIMGRILISPPLWRLWAS